MKAEATNRESYPTLRLQKLVLNRISDHAATKRVSFLFLKKIIWLLFFSQTVPHAACLNPKASFRAARVQAHHDKVSSPLFSNGIAAAKPVIKSELPRALANDSETFPKVCLMDRNFKCSVHLAPNQRRPFVSVTCRWRCSRCES